MYDLAVVIGRFQPFHPGHGALVQRAAILAKNVLINIGSANRPRSPKNPFTYKERQLHVNLWLGSRLFEHTHFYIQPLDDHSLDTDWLDNIKSNIKNTLERINPGSSITHGLKDYKIVIVGAEKDGDDSVWYLQWLKKQGFDVDLIESGTDINATDIRKALFGGYETLLDRVYESSKTLLQIIKQDYNSPVMGPVITWENSITHYKLDTKCKFPYITQTVDNLIIANLPNEGPHILVVKRKDTGLLAMPGGHLNIGETFRNAADRELREETGLVIDMYDHIRLPSYRVDTPNRSERGRVVTEVFPTKIGFGMPLRNAPSLKAGDDASRAAWVPIDSVKIGDFFEDHAEIIQNFLRKKS